VWHFVVQEGGDTGQAGGFILCLKKELLELSVNSLVSFSQVSAFIHVQFLHPVLLAATLAPSPFSVKVDFRPEQI
jgi:hypothetical protein